MNNQEKFNLSFIGIGSGKCGTTWLYNCLAEHPEICNYNPKEINYFSFLYKTHNYLWYQKQFRGCKDLIKGEFSVSYMENPRIAKRIRAQLPDVKIIALLRNPIRKTHSNYLHSIRKHEINSSVCFRNYIKNSEYLKLGNYYAQLKPFFTNFHSSQIMILILEDFTKELTRNFYELYKFIGVTDKDFIPQSIEKRINAAKNYKSLTIEHLITNTSKLLNKKGFTLTIEKLKKAGLPSLIRKLNEKNVLMQEIDSKSKKYLMEYFADSMVKLEKLIGKNLSSWN